MPWRLFAFLAVLAPLPAFTQDPKPPELTPEERKLETEADKLIDEAAKLMDGGKAEEALVLLRRAQGIAEKLYPASKFPNGHATLATILNNSGYALEELGDYPKAVAAHEQALAINRKLYPPDKYPAGHLSLAASFNNLGALFQAQGAFDKALPYFEETLAMMRKLYPKDKYPDGHSDLAASLNNLAMLHKDQGASDKALPYSEQALKMYQKLFPEARHPNGHPILAICLNNMGLLLARQGQHDQALSYYQQGLAMMRKLYPESKFPNGHPNLTGALLNTAGALTSKGDFAAALLHSEQALAMAYKLYPEAKFPHGHPTIALCHANLSSLLKDVGAWEKARVHAQQALAMNRKLFPASEYPNGHPQLVTSLNNLATALRDLEELDQALIYFEQALAMNRKLYPKNDYPNGHPDLALSLMNLTAIWKVQGIPDKAMPYCDQALSMQRELYPAAQYPDGHLNLAASLTQMGNLLQELGQNDKAAVFLQQALAMYRRLLPAARYPNGHPKLAECLSDLTTFYKDRDQFDEAIQVATEALAMNRRLYPKAQFPKGHASLAGSIGRLGNLYSLRGEFGKARPLIEEDLAMTRDLYPAVYFPDGHPGLATCLTNLGILHYFEGRPEQALPLCEQAAIIPQRLTRSMLRSASESEALAFVQDQPLFLDAYLSVALTVPNTAAASYRVAWESKAAITRVLALRHAFARLPAQQNTGDFTRLKEIRRRIEQLLGQAGQAAAGRDKELAALNDERDRLERELARALSMQAVWNELDKLTPAELSTALPKDTAMIDFIAYVHIEFDAKAARQVRVPSYVAFILAPGRPVKRVNLGKCEPLDNAVQAWRTAIQERKASPAPEQLQRLLWAPLAKHLPQGTKTLYISPDGNLARLPWAALPLSPSPLGAEGSGVRESRVLLEDYAIATVPHGPHLLAALRHPPRHDKVNSLLTLGDVAYNSQIWSALPGTRVEIEALAAIAPAPPTALTKATATAARLAETLPAASHAHLATHGQFQADAFVRATKHETGAGHRREMQSPRGAAGKNPLGFVGLVLANGEVMTGLSIVDLPLENLKLVTLSACETGLGELTEAEGVQGLQRAFHLAGCPNVIASLWKVNDAATAALMTKFYHELWINKKPPIEALREAQLTIYRRPDLIATLAAAERGIKLESALNDKGSPPAEAKDRTPTKLWAAFVLSGVGH
jgi:CHAT domain-containing protein/tetratricopeptide (TPR) repeat protein